MAVDAEAEQHDQCSGPSGMLDLAASERCPLDRVVEHGSQLDPLVTCRSNCVPEPVAVRPLHAGHCVACVFVAAQIGLPDSTSCKVLLVLGSGHSAEKHACLAGCSTG